jgi:AcrR family transcriptional regulator
VGRAARATERKEAVLEAALACFEELGYDATTVEDIRARSGASIGSIYHHFGSKEGIAAALYVETLEKYHAGMRGRAAAARSARAFVRGIVQYHLDWAAEHPARARYLHLMRRAESVREIEPSLRESTKEFLRELKAHADRWVERGELLDLPSLVFVAVVIGPAQELFRHWAAGRSRLDLASVRDPLADAAWRAVRADDTTKR